MQNVTINGSKFEVKGETPVKLKNGNLVIHCNKLGNVVGAYIVTSYRGSNNAHGSSTTSYCSFIDLDTGYIKFEERCSRNTNVQRILSHLNPGDYSGNSAIEEGQYIEMYEVGTYKIDLIFNRESNRC